MCFFSSPAAPAAPPPPAPAPAPAPPAASNPINAGVSVPTANNPVMTNIYDPSTPESGMAAEKGAISTKAKGTSRLKVDLGSTVTSMGKATGLQINR